MLMFADEIKEQANGLRTSEHSRIIESLYLDSMPCFSWKLAALLRGRGGNNRMFLRRMLMR